MNRATITLSLISLIGCKDNLLSDKMEVNSHIAHEDTANLLSRDADILYTDIKKSIVAWTGTKLMRSGKHEGTVNFKEGKMSFSNGKLVGGQFVVDMTSIYNTDIPKSDPVPRKNLTNHLNKDFETRVFPMASFIITGVTESNAGSYHITGDMTIKGISRPITVRLKEIERQNEYFSTFTFDRSLWKIGENGSWLEKKLVDADVHLEIRIILLQR